MGVYIKGMEMPKNCSDCPLCYDMMECSASDIRFFKVKEKAFDFCTERHPNCPLVEVPPHGDLFDITKVKIAPSDDEDIAYEIDFGNTIIPAEPFNNLSKPCKDDDDIPICTKASPASLGIYKKAEEREP